MSAPRTKEPRDGEGRRGPDANVDPPVTEQEKRMYSLEVMGHTRAPKGPYIAWMLDRKRGWRELACLRPRRRRTIYVVIAVSGAAGLGFAVWLLAFYNA